MIDAFQQIRQKLMAAYETIHELRGVVAQQKVSQDHQEKKLALSIIRQIDEWEAQQVPDEQLDCLYELLKILEIIRIPSPLDRSPEYGVVLKREKHEELTSGAVIRLEGGAYVRGDQLIRPAQLVVVD